MADPTDVPEADVAGGRSAHWDDAYRVRGSTGVSWYQPTPAVSLDLIDELGVAPGTPVVDVGGGESLLVDHLLTLGFDDLTVVDISAVALAEAEARVGEAPVRWVHADVLSWRPERTFGLWHDRAAFHFLVDRTERDGYVATLRDATVPGSAVVVATFAPDGPESCSGLPVARYSPEELATALGTAFELVHHRRESHETPAGAVQPFTWVAARRR